LQIELRKIKTDAGSESVALQHQTAEQANADLYEDYFNRDQLENTTAETRKTPAVLHRLPTVPLPSRISLET